MTDQAPYCCFTPPARGHFQKEEKVTLPSSRKFWATGLKGGVFVACCSITNYSKSQCLKSKHHLLSHVKHQLPSWLSAHKAQLKVLARVTAITRHTLERIHLLPTSFPWLLASLWSYLVPVLTSAPAPWDSLLGSSHYGIWLLPEPWGRE